MSYYTLVLGGDMNADGSALGPRTIGRLEQGLLYYHLGGYRLVVCSAKSPYHPNQEKTLGEMMADYLRSRGCHEVTVLQAKEFNTYGEITAFLEFLWQEEQEDCFIISAPFHLKRVKVLLRRDYPQALLPKYIRYLPVCEEKPTRKDILLEPLKLAQLYLPPEWRKTAVNWVRSCVPNTSY